MKKSKMLFPVLLLIVAMLAGCGGKDPGSETAPTEETVISKAGTYTGEDQGTVTITCDGVILKDYKAETIIISEAVGDGDVTLSNVSATNLEVYGGGEHSVHLEKSTFENVKSNKKDGRVRIVVKAGTEVGVVESENTTVEIEQGGAASGITANNSTIVVVAEGAKVEKVAIASETATAEISGVVSSVSVEAPKAAVTVNETATVQTVEVVEAAVEANVTISGDVAAVAVSAKDAAVTVEATAVVKTVDIAEDATAAKVEISGVVANVATVAPNSEITVAETATVVSIGVADTAHDATVIIAGKVEVASTAASGTNMTVKETAEVAVVSVEETAKETKVDVTGSVTTVATAADVTVSGTGKIEGLHTTDESFVKVTEESTITTAPTVVEDLKTVIEETRVNSSISNFVDTAINNSTLTGSPSPGTK